MPLVATLGALLQTQGVEPRAWLAAWLRVSPAVVLVPAFGLRLLPVGVRLAVGLALALVLLPAMDGRGVLDAPWPLLVVRELARGLPVALTAAAALWAASMAGGLVHDLGAFGAAGRGGFAGEAPLGRLVSMLVTVAFLEVGGASRLLAALAAAPVAGAHPIHDAVRALVAGVSLAVTVMAPVVAVAILAELGLALATRAAVGVFVDAAWPLLRSFLILASLALLLDAVAGVLATMAAASLGGP